MSAMTLPHYARVITRAFTKLSPLNQLRNPIMFVVYTGAVLSTIVYLDEAYGGRPIQGEPTWFALWVAVWLWITVVFANIAESIAEGRGKAQADSLRNLRKDIVAKRIKSAAKRREYQETSSCSLRPDDLVVIEAGDFVPGDGVVLDGIASVDESAITGESAPVIREPREDHNLVTAGTRVLSDWLVVRITSSTGEGYIDRMVSLVEGSHRQKTPNEIALSVLLYSLTLVFLVTVATLLPFSIYAVSQPGATGIPVSLTVLIALTVCLSPSTIGGLLSAIGIAGMNRLLKANVIASSGRAVEAAGDVSVLLLDKTGTITHGNRQAEEIFAAPDIAIEKLAEAAALSSLADMTPEGKSIVAMMRQRYKISPSMSLPAQAELINFSAETRISGIRVGERHVLKGAPDAVEAYLKNNNVTLPDAVQRRVEEIARMGGTPLVVIDDSTVLGVVYLKDIVKTGIKERLADLRRMGIKSVMITGDNPLTAAAIAAEAGVDDYVAQATPETKLKLIRKMQAAGDLVAMVGDGTNDAPALAQSDVAVVMNSGTQAAKEAGNMIDLDSDPTKMIEIVQIGKQLLMTRGSLTTFSIANDLAKYFAIIPAAFSTTYPALEIMNVTHLTSPVSAMLSAVIFNAVIIIFLIPLALRGVKYRAVKAAALLRRNLLIYGIGGIVTPFAGIKLIDMLLTAIGMV